MRWDPHPGPRPVSRAEGVLYAAADVATSLAEVYQTTRVIEPAPALQRSPRGDHNGGCGCSTCRARGCSATPLQLPCWPHPDPPAGAGPTPSTPPGPTSTVYTSRQLGPGARTFCSGTPRRTRYPGCRPSPAPSLTRSCGRSRKRQPSRSATASYKAPHWPQQYCSCGDPPRQRLRDLGSGSSESVAIARWWRHGESPSLKGNLDYSSPRRPEKGTT